MEGGLGLDSERDSRAELLRSYARSAFLGRRVRMYASTFVRALRDLEHENGRPKATVRQG